MNAREILGQCPLFAGVDDGALDALAGDATLVDVPSGERVFAQGEDSDHIFIVATGRLRAVLADGRVTDVITRLQPTGEIGAVLGERHSADVYAVRDSVLVRLPTSAMLDALRPFPDALLRLTRLITRRLRQNASVAPHAATVNERNSLAVVAATPSAPARLVAERLVETLSSLGETQLVDLRTIEQAFNADDREAMRADAHAARRLIEYLNVLEARGVQPVYLADAGSQPWARRCMRQADRVLLVIDAAEREPHGAMLEALQSSGTRATVDLVIVRAAGMPAGPVLAWKQRAGARAHYFVRADREEDFASLARQLTGRGVGLVLGGGGARGFAHVGLLQALRDLRIPVDVVGGSSMGAYFAALLACEESIDNIRRIARETFVAHNYLNDYVLPTVSLIRGRKFVRHLHDTFGDRSIESLRRPFFCMTTNLSRGTAVAHHHGPVYLWTATSMAVPGVAPPLVYNGELYADGSVINSLPTDVMQSLDRGPIIASDVSTEGGVEAPGVEGPDPEGAFGLKGDDAPRLLSILFRTATLTSESGVAARAARADRYLRMPVERIGMFDWKRMDEIVERAYQHALAELAPHRDRLAR
ncbi:cyclic nucleotide-binding and patatin-like phospholipase domain-containing protein [Solimonas marina]|uniref:Cyclic nucleotide-binding domain-containing protein n=1 Tax=Solimonas marina TaxID=2714601 RepID=A0A969W720_9GAMM|nr:cyclic nucleotide-binding and patatin-like phospholipase domain-containing protein [Solimonas marina]NKF20785.1 cyclic nucleotide-binding domain-containing protein [Solimonas marina]